MLTLTLLVLGGAFSLEHPGLTASPLQVAGEQKYHPECFSCLNCRAFIGDGDTYALVERSKLYWYVRASPLGMATLGQVLYETWEWEYRLAARTPGSAV